MNTGYSFFQIYQAERTRSAAEQRRVDACHGELAAALTRRWRRVTGPLRSLRSLRRPAYPAEGGWPEQGLAEDALAKDGTPAAEGQPTHCLTSSGR
jgi:hypothetical protein